MKTLKSFSQFISESEHSDVDLINLGLSDPKELFLLPIGNEYDDEDGEFDERSEGDLKALEWLGYPDRVVMFSPNSVGGKPSDAVKLLGPIGDLIYPGDPNERYRHIWMSQVNVAGMKVLYTYSESHDWGTYLGTEVGGKRVVVLDAPDGPYFIFSPDEFGELDLWDHAITVRK